MAVKQIPAVDQNGKSTVILEVESSIPLTNLDSSHRESMKGMSTFKSATGENLRRGADGWFEGINTGIRLRPK